MNTKHSHKQPEKISQSPIPANDGNNKPHDEQTTHSFTGRLMSLLADYGPLILSARYFASSRRGGGRRNGLRLKEWQNVAAGVLIIAGIISGLATYAALTETPPLGNDPNTVFWLLNIDFILLLSLVALIAHRIVGLWSGRKRGIAGSHLHVRLVYTFSLLAAVPAILMTVFSAFFFHFGVQTWFSERIQTAVGESQAVAQAYVEEHKQVIKADILAMANDLDRQAFMLSTNPQTFERLMRTQSMLRNLSEAIVFDSSGQVLSRAGLSFSLELEDVPPDVMERTRDGDVVITTGENDDRVRALVKLNNFVDSFLFVGRLVDPQVLSHLDATKEAAESYKSLQARMSSLQIIVTMIFVVVGLLMVLAAIWFGLLLARQLVNPISQLITASDRVRAGDLGARVEEVGGVEEFEYLARSFNRMTHQIEEQQSELIDANRQLDRRRRFTETVLAGVSSGVIGVDDNSVINLANSAALKLLGVEKSVDITGKSLNDILPGAAELLEQAYAKPGRMVQAEVPYARSASESEDSKHIFLLRAVSELISEKDKGAILTFDDMTELQSAQRKAAWADVARRIAHEIKNPLTPIQLSAERLKRKYINQITDDPETFSQCTDTIIRHVGDIGRMVNEFSSFARMPDPVMKAGDVLEQVRQVMLLEEQAHPEITFNLIADRGHFPAKFDSQQIRQASLNILQNAVEAILMKDNGAGEIDILVDCNEDGEIFMAITDSGAGLPKGENPIHLTEPYVTHKPKGTGLGLAIVKKIMEDHAGRLILGTPDWLRAHAKWRDMGGASVILVLPGEER
ncbi:MAG: PAS domain-containing sensor histidine kinase [Alphaproteobacteria bacterium]|nr:PAS domain-containing sensor histidine kinase [Alphaproteobacteria bacterium]MCD8526230.1 PAS domain-containing sensor histidine kinase [Alphaproteobacteria bacterium]MCD8570753.1 PAS domain-containing sensor histidine kinase [Alphaproteobacteria bacterium]